jgi:hypothetical protein
MDPYQRQRLREYEYQLQNARYGFFGADWLTAILLFEALDNDYMYVGDPSSFDTGGFGGDWGGGVWGGGVWGRRRFRWRRLRWGRLRWGRFLALHRLAMPSPRIERDR